jgi:asparagine synthase (glutamine-hydrolysing)
MCGVAGILAAPGEPPTSIATLQDMIALLGHRSPDGYGLYRDERVGLAHGRLSIIDLEGGFQPITNEDRSVWLSFNGEIFNFVELRRELRAQGHRFRTSGDSEVIVHLYEQYGEGAWSRLNGQFAFALWDRRVRRLWLVRDRFGILPMYYAHVGRSVVFGSEAKALLASGRVDAQVDPVAVGEVFARWSAAAPRSLFAGVRSVCPGTALTFDDSLVPRETRYWQADLSGSPALGKLSVQEAADELGELLSEAVRLRLRADVPVGAYLSGGLDSSVIASLIRSADTSRLQTFAVRFTDPAFDETAEQRHMASLLGTEHHEVLCDRSDIREVLEPVVWHCETPLLRTAPAPLFLLSGLVREHGMKVVLTGEGADELFAGYGIFKEDKIRRFWARDPGSELRPKLLARVHGEVGAGVARNTELWQRFFGRHLTEVDDPLYSHRIRWENTAWTRRLLASDVRDAGDAGRFVDAGRMEFPSGWSSWTDLSRAQWLEIETFLSPYLLSCQGDRVAMAHGIEVRYPYLDPKVADFAFGLPSRLKMPGLRDKLTLRTLAQRSLPREVAQRPKIPYRAPMTAPFFGPDSGGIAEDLLSEAECKRFGLVDARVADRLVTKARRLDGRLAGEREEMALVGALTLQLWARSFLDDFATRVRERRASLDVSELHVFEDLVGDPLPEGVPATEAYRA